MLLVYTENGISTSARFVYDVSGEVRGFILNDSAVYMYLKNAQGDVTAVVDESGAVVIRYSYNAWGEAEYTVPYGVDPADTALISKVSPFTYRGYCYDFDIGLYYLQSRYYDPKLCRFINADSTDYLGATGTPFSYNLFAYCENDPVNCVDPKGTWGKSVHYNDTKKWAKKVGFNETESELIAQYDNKMDNIKNHAMFIENQHIHFNTNINKGIDSRTVFAMTNYLLAVVLWDEIHSTYLKDLSDAPKKYSGNQLSIYKRQLYIDLNNYKGYCLELLGQGLHSIQDIEGHGQTEPTIEAFGLTYTQHAVSSGNKRKNRSDNIWYSWTNSNKTHLKFDLYKERYYFTECDSKEYLDSFLKYRNELYNKKYKSYFSEKEFEFNGFIKG